MNENLNVNQLKQCLDTSFLISEIRKLAQEINDCCLLNIQSNYLIDDIQKYKTGKIIDRYQQFNDGSLKCFELDNRRINSKVARECFSEIIDWQRGAAQISESDNGLYDEVIEEKKQRKRRIKKQKSYDDSRCLDPSNQDEVEEEIRRQREKFYEDKGWMVKEKQSHKKYRKLWKIMIKKELGKAARQRTAIRKEKNITLRKAARDCSRFCRQRAIASQKCAKDALNRGRRLAREISMCWRQLEKEEKTSRKKADKILTEQKRKNLEMLDAKRQQRKLNYLITQTELYTHFMSRKMSKEDSEEVDDKVWAILSKIEDDGDDKTADSMFDVNKAMANVKEAVNKQAQQIQSFVSGKETIGETTPGEDSIPSLFQGELKSYQKKGVEWLLYLFEQGINGILADEMGLGKTIQTIAFLATLAEKYDLWGPFLIVAPASTVHNWTQEFNRFLPAFHVVPYWGSVGERKILRRFWNSGSNARHQPDGDCNNSSSILLSDSNFHVVVSSYQVVLQDAKMVSRVRWQYLVLDEAHAIKNTSSQRWNTLLSFECRNRLLLTGTPIQNTMQELWALLHFVMPTLFDSHEEFNDWFSRDIESQATAAAQGVSTSSGKQAANLTTTKLNATQLSRLHLILQPFMLRRVKIEVEHELPDKIEKMLQCHLSSRQTTFYHRLKRRIRIDDLNIDSLSRQQKSLLNLVMQLRKVCNHPDLVEPRIEKFSVSTRFIDQYMKWPRLIALSLEPLYKPRSLVISHFILCHPFLSNDFFYNGPSSVFSVLSVFRIKPIHLYFFMMGTNTRALIEDRHNSMETLAWHCLYSEHPLHRFSFYTNISSYVIDLLHRHLDVELIYSLDYYSVLNWTIQGNSNNSSRILRSMSTGFGVISTLLIVSPIVATPVQLGVSIPTTAPCTLFPWFRDLLRFRGGPITVEPVSNETRISDSAKLSALDKLLTKLKREGHRVLVYSQMTRMIDIIEDLMRLRGHSFIRLDGSSRLCDRRDMVAEFQSGQELFAFLLSTRAGGLGINLTAADTVIFFDSDWNPTVDQQAMDRAHRLGQNKQVTVYRLVCRDTVEEKILFRAEEKRQMHKMVIAGADLTVDQMRPRDVASLLLEDDEMNIRLEQRRKQAAVNRGGVPRNMQTMETADAGCFPVLQRDSLCYSPDEKGGSSVTFSESALQKKRRMAWAGVTKGGGRPKKLKLLEPTINNGGVQIKRTPSTCSHISSISEAIAENKKT